MDRDRLPHLITKYQPCGKETKDDSSKDFSTVNGTGTGHEVQNPACYIMRNSPNQYKKVGNISKTEM